MNYINCPSGCCKLKYIPCEKNMNQNIRIFRENKKKAGICIYDPNKNVLLLVQSRGNFWGIPKGTIKEGENIDDCAIREVKEETGISIEKSQLTKYTIINSTATYFYTEISMRDVTIQFQIPDNDANGIGWIKLDCLKDCVEKDIIRLNKHGRTIIQRFFNVL